ncbi:MAG TPA: hypothetical protein VH560_04595 [Polyangia bacterium]|nr:hypothetical protein [Polyangia bacterium]
MRPWSLRRTIGRAAGVLALAFALLETGACTVGVGYDGYDTAYPSDSYIATTEPVYYDGRATYWYGGAWYYRDGGGWRHYDHEPPALYQRRVQVAPARRNYEPQRAAGGWRGSPAPSRGAPSGNWRGGGGRR